MRQRPPEARPADQAQVASVMALTGGPLAVTIRRTARARGMRVTIHPDWGVVVTLPPSTRTGWRTVEPMVRQFLQEREPWLRRHLARHERLVAEIGDRGLVEDGGTIRYRGELHRLRIAPAAPRATRSTVERHGDADEDALVLRLADRDRRSPPRVLVDWCRERAREAIDRSIVTHAEPLSVAPVGVVLRDPRTRWGSASRQRRLSFSWRLILAPPDALDTVVVHELAHLRVFGHGPRFWDLVASRRPDHRVWRRWLRQHAYELHAACQLRDQG